MIQEQSQDYEKTAVRLCATEKTRSQQIAGRSIPQYIQDNIMRFIKMDKAQKLEVKARLSASTA